MTSGTSGLSSERLKRIDAFLQNKYIDTGKLSGAVMLVAKHGEIAHFSTLGNMDVERGKSTEQDSIYRIYSMTKPITSVALMTLYEEGLFQLNDPVAQYLPEWADVRVWVSGESPDFQTKPVERQMTIRDLLSHQSGLTYGFGEEHPVDLAYPPMLPSHEITDSLADWSKSVAEIPLLFEPDTGWNYSIGTDVCGRLIEVLSRKSFDVFLQERIFDPLGMVDTGFSVPDDKISRFAANYSPTEDGGIELEDDPETSTYRQHPTFFSGGAGLVSTASDYQRFGQMLLNNGTLDGNRILSRKTVELMTSNHLSGGKSISESAVPGAVAGSDMHGYGFGLGFGVLQDVGTAQIAGSPGQFYWGGAASTLFWVDPVEELVVVFMTQLYLGELPAWQELQVLVNAAIDD